MGTLKYPRPCDNPLCGQPIQPRQPYSLILRVAHGSYRPATTWTVCNGNCLHQLLDLGAVGSRVHPVLDRPAGGA